MLVDWSTTVPGIINFIEPILISIRVAFIAEQMFGVARVHVFRVYNKLSQFR